MELLSLVSKNANEDVAAQTFPSEMGKVSILLVNFQSKELSNEGQLRQQEHSARGRQLSAAFPWAQRAGEAPVQQWLLDSVYKFKPS